MTEKLSGKTGEELVLVFVATCQFDAECRRPFPAFVANMTHDAEDEVLNEHSNPLGLIQNPVSIALVIIFNPRCFFRFVAARIAVGKGAEFNGSTVLVDLSSAGLRDAKIVGFWWMRDEFVAFSRSMCATSVHSPPADPNRINAGKSYFFRFGMINRGLGRSR